MIYGTGCLEPPVYNVIGDANYTRMEFPLGYGRLVNSIDQGALGFGGDYRRAAVYGNSNYSGASNTSPIVLHALMSIRPFVTGDSVIVTGMKGNTAANGIWKIVKRRRWPVSTQL